MALIEVDLNVDAESPQVNQVIRMINGTPGYGQPLVLTQLADPNNYAALFRNLDSENGRIIQALSPSDIVLFQVTQDGVLASVDGGTASAIVNATGVQNLSNKTLVSPVFSGILDINDLVKLGQGADVASAASIALGNDGNSFEISGTTTISNITIKDAGVVVQLRFLAACSVSGSGNINLLNGPFIGRAGATLTLLSDGAEWNELSRSGAVVASSRLNTTSDITQSFTSGDVIDWQNADWNHGSGWSGGDPSKWSPGTPGRIAVRGTVLIRGGDIWAVQLYKNGSLVSTQARDRDESFDTGKSYAINDEVVCASGSDYLQIFVQSDSSTNNRVKAGSHVNFRWIEPV